MILVDFSIFYTGGSYGHANGCIDVTVPYGPGASINLSAIASTPPPPCFSGQIRVESVIPIEGVGNSYACADVCVATEAEALLLGTWLDRLPGLSVWPSDLGDPR
jgi:hypothetical protein